MCTKWDMYGTYTHERQGICVRYHCPALCQFFHPLRMCMCAQVVECMCGTCIVLLSTNISPSDIIALHYVNSSIFAIPSIPSIHCFPFPMPLCSSTFPIPSLHYPTSPISLPSLLPFKARPGHWMACRHVLLCAVQGGGCHHTLSDRR